MLQIPPMVFDGTGVFIDGHLRLMGLIAIVALLAAYGVLLWAMHATRHREHTP